MRYPEAGGSSSFARHAFNELVSFGAAWAQMLNYIITIAISAFFVPHYLSIFWEPLRENPWDVVGGAVVIVVLVGAQRRRDQGGRGPEHLPRRPRLRDAAPARADRLRAHLQPERPRRQRPLGRRADLELVLPRDPGRDDRLHRASRRSRTWPRRRATRRATSRARSGSSRSPSSRSTSRCRDRALGAAGERVDGEYQTLLGLPPEEGGFANDPVLGLVENLDIHGLCSTRSRSTSACSPRRSSSSPRTPA